jgi:hypothetical protein
MQTSERCLEPEDWCGWHLLSGTRPSKVNIVKRRMRVSTTLEEGNRARSGMCP